MDESERKKLFMGNNNISFAVQEEAEDVSVKDEQEMLNEIVKKVGDTSAVCSPFDQDLSLVSPAPDIDLAKEGLQVEMSPKKRSIADNIHQTADWKPLDMVEGLHNTGEFANGLPPIASLD